MLRTVLLVLLFSASAPAYLIYTAPPHVMAPHADLVVRGEIDFDTGRVTVRKVYRGEVPEAGLVLRGAARLHRDMEAESMLADAPVPGGDAFLFLREHDGRHHLVETSSPWWVRAHASVFFVGKDGVILGFRQVVNPGPPVLTPMPAELGTVATFEKALVAWMALPRVEHDRSPALSADETRRFHAVVDPVLDTYRRHAKKVPLERIAETASTLAEQIAATSGDPRHRRIEALLLLAAQNGADPSRRTLVENLLNELLAKVGAEPFLEPAFRELRSVDVFSSKETAAKLLRRIGGEAVTRARRLLVGMVVETDDVTLSTRASWALRHLGCEKEAETALDARRKLGEDR